MSARCIGIFLDQTLGARSRDPTSARVLFEFAFGDFRLTLIRCHHVNVVIQQKGVQAVVITILVDGQSFFFVTQPAYTWPAGTAIYVALSSGESRGRIQQDVHWRKDEAGL
jgi:hypothetical protein